MRTLLIALALTFSASLVQADVGTSSASSDIAWKVAGMGAGSTLVMKDRAGVLTHIKRGTEGALHVFDVYAGEGARAEFAGSYKTNAKGDVVQSVAFDGAVTQFIPNRCNRTVGECHFTMVHPDGFREQRVRVTHAIRGGLEYKEYGLGGLLTEGQLIVDKTGTAKDGWQRDDTKDEQKQRTRRVLLALK